MALFPRIHNITDSCEIQKMMYEMQCELDQFTGRIISMSMYNDIARGNEENEELCIANSKNCGRTCKKKCYGSNTNKPNGEWDDVAEHMLLNFGESGHPVFRGTSALERGFLRSKEGGKLSKNFCGGPLTVEVVFRSIISVNQLSIHGAVCVKNCLRGFLTVLLARENLLRRINQDSAL